MKRGRDAMLIDRLGVGVLLAFAIAAVSNAQWNKKPYDEWSENEALKVLNDSPWGQTQIFTDTSQMFDRGRRADSNQSRVADVFQVNFRIRFLSAKPIRQAISRVMQLQQGETMSEDLAAQLKSFASGEFPDYVVVTVTAEAPKPSNYSRDADSLLRKLTTAELKNRTYLLVKGGERVFLQEYQSPRPDGLGARFVFPRVVNDKPVISSDNGEVQFYSELSGAFTLNMRYKVKDMMYDGKLEY
jgi:hypothetical protein